MGLPDIALQMAMKTFDDAVGDLDQIEGDGKETYLIM